MGTSATCDALNIGMIPRVFKSKLQTGEGAETTANSSGGALSELGGL